jgi:molybdopterin-guanine dinucleotide biosynthesis protein
VKLLLCRVLKVCWDSKALEGFKERKVPKVYLVHKEQEVYKVNQVLMDNKEHKEIVDHRARRDLKAQEDAKEHKAMLDK